MKAIKSLLRISLVLLALVGIGVLALRMSKGSTKRPVDSWVVPSMRATAGGAGFELVRGVEWVGDRQKAAAEQLLASDVATPLEKADLKTFAGPEPVAGAEGCIPYLVRGMAEKHGSTDSTRVWTDGETIDVLVYGSYGCHLYDLPRAPFVACLTSPPKQVLTSFRCESPGLFGWLVHGPGDRW